VIRKILLAMFQTTFKMTQMLFPALAGKWAVRLFFTPRKFQRPKRESDFLRDGQKMKIPFRSDFKMGDQDDYYVRYDWCDKGPVVLLVHGWEGRGSQMGRFVEPLRKAGYRVISFDAIAHGDSPGKRTNMPEFAQIIKDIDKDVGGFHAIIGHSLGGTAAGYAVAEGVRTDKLITICSPATIEFILEAFAQQIHASQKTIRRLSQFLENFTGKSPGEFSFTNFAAKLKTAGQIIHDKHDKEIPFSQALALHKNWNESQLIFTERLGHRRILRDKEIISKIIDFIMISQSIESPNYSNSYYAT
jgi:pimeloyl-ACP methyl ester carboxylesterase